MKRKQFLLHLALFAFVGISLTPFIFVINNSFRSNSEIYQSYFGFPDCIKKMVQFTAYHFQGRDDQIKLVPLQTSDVNDVRREPEALSYPMAMSQLWKQLTTGYSFSWKTLRPYMLNSFIVSLSTVAGVLLIGTMSAFIFSRYRFPGDKILFGLILSLMMIPGILTLVPSFLLVKKLGLLNSYWVLILPYVAGGQVMAIYLFKSFFDDLPQDLFEAAHLDGATPLQIYWHVVLPLSLPVVSVVSILKLVSSWNNFLWPFITNTDAHYHVIASGLYLMNSSNIGSNFSTMFASYIISSLPLLILFLYATKPFIRGVTSGAFKS